MEKSKVYFTDMRALPGTSLLTKLQRLIRKAGIGDIDMKERFVAIKIHFGEPGNLSYLRPNFAKAVVDVVKEQGGEALSHRLQHPVCGAAEKCAGSSGSGVGERLHPLFLRMSRDHCRRPEGDG